MPKRDKEYFPCCDWCGGHTNVYGLQLDDGPYLENYVTTVQVDDGEPFTIELYPNKPKVTEYNVLGNNQIMVVSDDTLQRWYDEGRLTVVEE